MAKLALAGGTKLKTGNFPSWPYSDENEISQLLEVLESGLWGTLGPKTAEFEKIFAEYLDVSNVQTVANGTVSLEIILRALGIGRGDEVIIPPYTFVATATAVMMVNATPVFADVDPETNCIDPNNAESKITEKTKAIIPVHVAGFPADMDSLTELAKKYNLALIEDAAQAPGSEWKGKRLGSIGTAGSFSFQLSKNMSSGEGGAISTNDKDLADRIWSIHHVGRKKEAPWYEHFYLSSNFRMTDWQAGVLLAQLSRLDKHNEIREKNAALLNSLLKEIPGIEIFSRDPRATKITWHLYMFRYNIGFFKGLSKNRFVEALIEEGIPASTGYKPLNKQPIFQHKDVQWLFPEGNPMNDLKLPGLDAACKKTVWIMQYALLGTEEDIVEIAEAIKKIQQNVDEIL